MPPLTRRRFCELATAAVAAGIGATLAGCADTLRASLGRVSQAKASTAPAGWRQLAALSALNGTPAPFPLATANGGDTVYAYVQGGKAVALSNVCTHRGCSVAWDASRSAFACPCHGGVFDRTGKVTAGPPPAPLASYPTQITSGVVYVQA